LTIIRFREGSTYDGHRHGVAFTAYVDDEPRRCLVSDDALDYHFSGDNARTGDARRQLFEDNRALIQDAARYLIEAGHTGDIVIRSSDFI